MDQQRRDFLKTGGLATAGLVGLAGCSGGGSGDGGSGDGGGGTTTGGTMSSGPVEFVLGHGLAAEEPLWAMDVLSDDLDNWGEAYEADFTSFPANTKRLQAFQAGEIQAGTNSAISNIFAVNRGLKLTVVAGIMQETEDKYSTAIMRNPDSDVELSESGIKGKKFGVCAFKSACDQWPRGAAMQFGLDPDDDITVVKVPFPSTPGAVGEGRVDAAVMPHPFDLIGKNENGLEFAFDGRDALGYDHDTLGLWFGDEFLQNNPDTVRAFLEDYKTARDMYVNNVKDVKSQILEAGFVKTPEQVYLNMSDYAHQITPITDSLEKINQLAVDLGWMDSPIDVNKLWDLQYLPEDA